jgi:CheY-like chemotaxis protein
MRHILVVDDDPAIRDVVVDILEMSDYAVQTATNGAEALEQLCSHPPRAILLDLMMPVMNGWEFLRECRRRPTCKRVPVAVMSAARDAAAAADELGAQAFLTKPFDMDRVLSIVADLSSRSGPPAGGAPPPG